jgi:hypothetical protein
MLRTSRGTETLLKLADGTEFKYKSAAYDSLNKVLLIFDDSLNIWATEDNKTLTNVGTLTGDSEVITTLWEDGLLIASGGNLQYYKGGSTVETISTSPANCKGVFTRSGRVLAFDNSDNVLFSGVGDETAWATDSNDPSAALFAQIGYKVGGKIIGMVNMSQDILFIKDNGMIFRMMNEYPNWEIAELGRNVWCRGRASFCDIGTSVMLLGLNSISNIVTTQDYGDLKPENIGSTIVKEIASMPTSTKLRYVPSLNQVWFVEGDNYVLVYDILHGSFYQRYFNSNVVDVVSTTDNVYVIKDNALTELSDNNCSDDDKDMYFRAVFKTDFSVNQLLVSKAFISFSPYEKYYDDSNTDIRIGKLDVVLPNRKMNDDEASIKDTVSNNVTASSNRRSRPYDGYEDVALNRENLNSGEPILFNIRGITRGYRIPLYIEGKGFSFVLHYLGYAKAEVSN